MWYAVTLSKSQVRVVVIGANDMLRDPMRPFLSNKQWSGMLVEPNPDANLALRRLFQDNSRIVVEEAAVSDNNGIVNLYCPRHPADSRLTEMSSVREEWFARHMGSDGMKTVTVPSATLNDLLRKHRFSQVDILQTDTEGSDYAILSQMDFTKWRPFVIVYEHLLMTETERSIIEKMLRDNAYRCVVIGYGRDMTMAMLYSQSSRLMRRAMKFICSHQTKRRTTAELNTCT